MFSGKTQAVLYCDRACLKEQGRKEARNHPSGAATRERRTDSVKWKLPGERAQIPKVSLEDGQSLPRNIVQKHCAHELRNALGYLTPNEYVAMPQSCFFPVTNRYMESPMVNYVS